MPVKVVNVNWQSAYSAVQTKTRKDTLVMSVGPDDPQRETL
jgi:hypothetical protein